MQPADPWRRRLLAAAGALILLLPGCSGTPWRRTAPESPRRAPPVDVVARWRALGKFTARTADGGGHWNGSLDWRQTHEEFRIRLSGPFGQGGFQVKGRPGEVELATARGMRRSAGTAEALFVREFGWDLPASFLRHWITARARPGVPVEDWAFDGAGRLSSLAQQGWRLDYEYREDRRGDPRGRSLPDRITLRGEEVVVRIAIRDWRVE